MDIYYRPPVARCRYCAGERGGFCRHITVGKQYPATNEFKAGIVAAYHPSGSLARSQFLALQAVALTLTGTVLVVVCLNISGMIQVGSAMRERELSIRQAIGASRKQLVRHLLSEAIVLAGLGGALAAVVLFNIPSVLSWSAERPLPVQVQEALRLDRSIVAIGVGLCLVTSLLFGLLPATRCSRPVIISALKDDAGVVGLMVAMRTREIAVRVALGASRRRVIGMILFDVVKLVTPGVAIGLVLTAALNRLDSENMGISLSNVEPLAYVAGAAIAILVAVVASLAPARRAASVQPMVAMRSI